MARKKTQKQSAPERLWNRFSTTIYKPRALILITLFCLSPIVYGLAVTYLPSPSQIPESFFTVDKVELIDHPEWVPKDLMIRAWKQEKLDESISIHKPFLTKTLARILEASPWVEKVDRVELRPMANVKIYAQFRRPIAFVRTYNGLFPIDRNGILLPTRDFTSRDRYRFPLISSAYSLPQGPAGSNWGDLAIIGAARLAETLAPKGDVELYWKKYDFDAIEIPRPQEAGRKLEDIEYRIRIKSQDKGTTGSIIVWGNAPGLDHPREPGDQQKLKRIEKYWNDFGDFQKPHGPYVIDIRPWNSTIREPIASSQLRPRR